MRRVAVANDDRNTGPREGAEGIVEGIKGKAKEVLGKLTGDQETHREGQAQQDKAEAEREVAAREAEADKARTEAEAHEERQRAHE
jgi:uncharacterized protein YjbJ (UPF0337 family)